MGLFDDFLIFCFFFRRVFSPASDILIQTKNGFLPDSDLHTLYSGGACSLDVAVHWQSRDTRACEPVHYDTSHHINYLGRRQFLHAKSFLRESHWCVSDDIFLLCSLHHARIYWPYTPRKSEGITKQSYEGVYLTLRPYEQQLKFTSCAISCSQGLIFY